MAKVGKRTHQEITALITHIRTVPSSSTRLPRLLLQNRNENRNENSAPPEPSLNMQNCVWEWGERGGGLSLPPRLPPEDVQLFLSLD